LALKTPKFYLAGSKRARKSGFLWSIDRKKPQFEQALSLYAKWKHITYDITTNTVNFLSARGDWGSNWNTAEALKIRDFYSGQLERESTYKITVLGNLDTPLPFLK
jgi:hypothetical protein